MDQNNRRLPVATGVLLAALAALVVVEWPRLRAWYKPPQTRLPGPEEVIRLRATAWASGSRGQMETDVPWFEVPVEPGRRIWRRFTPNEYVGRPNVDPVAPLGELEATAANGDVTRVRFYETLADDLVFTVDGEHFFRAEPRNDQGYSLGGGLFLAGTLRHAWLTAPFAGVIPPEMTDEAETAVLPDPTMQTDQAVPDMKSLSIK